MRTPLPRELRNALERSVLDARDTAEEAAREALVALGVGDARSPGHLDEGGKKLRAKLRARAKALGGERGADDTQKTAALREEIAYEHWHRMLFARFLVENGLLMYDDGSGMPLAVTLDDCGEIARETGAGSKWAFAAGCAEKMLPGVFRTDSLAWSISFPPDRQRRLEGILDRIPPATFQASDALGWVYQFWQTRKKAEINDSLVKIGADELPAMTQLFTEPYMVAFLYDNSLGAWYAAPKLKGRRFGSEAEARAAVATPAIPLEYLRLVETEAGSGEWRPAAGDFAQWPKALKDFSLLDPCCGSGHFLVAGLFRLVPMRMELEGIDAREAIDRVLRENLHGLELDRRCVELAAFAVALEAWRWPEAGGVRPLPPPKIACVGIAPSDKKEKWEQAGLRTARKSTPRRQRQLELAGLATDKPLDLWESSLFSSMGKMWELFQQAPTLGSLIDPYEYDRELGDADCELVAEALLDYSKMQSSADQRDEQFEATVAALGIRDAIQLLIRRYTLVITNVPYLARGKQDEDLQVFCSDHYPNSKADLATVFIDRWFCNRFSKDATLAVVSPQNWFFAARYRNFRTSLLSIALQMFLSQLGSGAFSTITGEVVKVGLSICSKESGQEPIFQIDANSCQDIDEKCSVLRCGKLLQTSRKRIMQSPDSRIIFGNFQSEEKILEEYAVSYQGIVTGDINRFLHFFWECFNFQKWDFYINAPREDSLGLVNCIKWEQGCGDLHQYARETRAQLHDMHESGNRAWGKGGIAIGRITRLASPYYGAKFDNSVATIVPHNPKDIPAIFVFLQSQQFRNSLALLDQKLSLTNATVLRVPFSLEYWHEEAIARFPNGLPMPYTNDPTQWLFHGHPCGSVVWDEETKRLKVGEDREDGTVLHVAVARLLGYRWPAELDEGMELAPEMREVMGRNAALEGLADGDGIVCIPAVRGERPAADRLEAMLAAAYGEKWRAEMAGRLLEAEGSGARTLEGWLRDKYFLRHAKLFGNRPFVWQIWDGRPDGFSALVLYHKLDRRLLESLTYTYLGDWIVRQRAEASRGVDGAEEKVDAALALQGKLAKILEGEAPFDIFVRWKDLAHQPKGWEPDLDDGVRLNIRPFCEAGVLREKTSRLGIKWTKDRGADLPSAPWYGSFGGERRNDHHTTLAEKAAAGVQSGE